MTYDDHCSDSYKVLWIPMSRTATRSCAPRTCSWKMRYFHRWRHRNTISDLQALWSFSGCPSPAPPDFRDSASAFLLPVLHFAWIECCSQNMVGKQSQLPSASLPPCFDQSSLEFIVLFSSVVNNHQSVSCLLFGVLYGSFHPPQMQKKSRNL